MAIPSQLENPSIEQRHDCRFYSFGCHAWMLALDRVDDNFENCVVVLLAERMDYNVPSLYCE